MKQLGNGNGHLSICQLIVDNVDDKNPKSNDGLTPLHCAAAYGHLSVCQLIFESVDDKNPNDHDGWTPLHWAAFKGHSSVCQFIVQKINEKNPKNNKGQTPSLLSRNPKIKKLIENAIKEK